MNTINDQQFINDAFRSSVHVFDREKGYLSVPSFNLRIDPKVLQSAARLIANHYKGKEMHSIHGIPHSGNYLAAAVALELGGKVRLHTSRKSQIIPATWKEVYRKEVRSFTQSDSGVDVIGGINLSFVRKGDRILLVDDVCAKGDTGLTLIKGLLEQGIKVVGYAVQFDKVFQGGLDRIKEMGIDVFSCVRVKSIGKNDAVELL